MAEHSKNIVIAGGGTGGHLYPGIALAQEFEKRGGFEILFIGTSYGIENRVLPTLPYAFRKIWIRGLQRKVSPGNLLFPLRLAVSLAQCMAIFVQQRPSVIIGTGGYVSGPALLTGLCLRIPTVIQEQNSYPGLVNRWLGKRVRQVHITFEESRRYFSGQPQIHLSGNPIRTDIKNSDRRSAARQLGLDNEKTTLFVFGGSQGARGINQALARALPEISRIEQFQVLWATGPGAFDEFSAAADPLPQVKTVPFIEDMAAAYAASDFVLCRSGATTLAEIAVTGLPAILVPFPYATADHQTSNAQAAARAGAAEVIPEKDLTPERLAHAVTKLAGDPKKRESMSQAVGKLARPEAARNIVDKVIALIEEG